MSFPSSSAHEMTDVEEGTRQGLLVHVQMALTVHLVVQPVYFTLPSTPVLLTVSPVYILIL